MNHYSFATLVGEKTPLFSKLGQSYVEERKIEEDTTKHNLIATEEKIDPSSDDSLAFDDNKEGSEGSSASNKYRRVSTSSTTSQKNKVRLMRIRTVCLVIALMVHSLFEGLTVGLQLNTMGVVVLVALLTFHKCLVGFSLGIALVFDKSSLRSFQKKAVS